MLEKTDDQSLSFSFPVRIITQMFLVLLAMITAGPVCLGNASAMGSIEHITLNAGTSGNIPFELAWIDNDDIEVYPYFTLSFESKERPFHINGLDDPKGFLNETQISRFTVNVTESRKGLLAVNVHIANVDMLDAAVYAFTVILFDDPNNWREKLRKEVEVRIPRGPAKCKITKSNYSIHLREAHCSATRGEHNTSLTCYQYGKKVPYKCPIQMSVSVTSGVFWLDEYGPVSCCSHSINTRLSESVCKDFEYPGQEEDKLSDISTTAGLIVRNEPSSLSPVVTVTGSGCTKHSETFCSLYYLLLFTLTIFVI